MTTKSLRNFHGERLLVAVTPQTRLVATHFSHNGKLGHEELTRAFLPHGIEVAFDGMMIEA